MLAFAAISRRNEKNQISTSLILTASWRRERRDNTTYQPTYYCFASASLLSIYLSSMVGVVATNDSCRLRCRRLATRKYYSTVQSKKSSARPHGRASDRTVLLRSGDDRWFCTPRNKHPDLQCTVRITNGINNLHFHRFQDTAVDSQFPREKKARIHDSVNQPESISSPAKLQNAIPIQYYRCLPGTYR